MILFKFLLIILLIDAHTSESYIKGIFPYSTNEWNFSISFSSFIV